MCVCLYLALATWWMVVNVVGDSLFVMLTNDFNTQEQTACSFQAAGVSLESPLEHIPPSGEIGCTKPYHSLTPVFPLSLGYLSFSLSISVLCLFPLMPHPSILFSLSFRKAA